MRIRAWGVVAIGVMMGSGAALAAGAPFEAEVLIRSEEQPPVAGHLHLAGDGLRLELEQPGEEEEAILLSGPRREGVWMLLPAERRAIRLLEGGAAGELAELQGEDPCAGEPGLRCERAGRERVDGRTTVKWRATDEDGRQIATYWVDPKLQFPVRVEQEGWTMELRGIREGPQPEILFVVPEGYQHMPLPPGPGIPDIP